MPSQTPLSADTSDLRVEPLGDAALLVQIGGEMGERRSLAAALVEACRDQPLPSICDVVQAFDVVGVFFDPTAGEQSGGVERWVRERRATLNGAPRVTSRTHTLPVCYDREFAPDLAALAAHAGLSEEEAVRRHSGAEYTVGAVGFTPGFGYLEGLPVELQMPRRDTPRTRVPGGAVAVGGTYTAIYPNESPGGWNLVGRCPLRMFDPLGQPPAVLQAGDRVKFEQIDRDRFAELEEHSRTRESDAPDGTPALRVVSPGVQSTLQDLGRRGVRRWGVAVGGAVDTTALRIANALVGNPAGAVAMEATLVGPVLECLADCEVSVAGGVPEAIGGSRRLSLSVGDRLDLRGLTGGRAYLAVQGGFAASTVLGGAGTDLQAGFGGLGGRMLRSGDSLHQANATAAQRADSRCDSGRFFVGREADPDVTVLRILPGPHRSAVDPTQWEAFISTVYEVSSESSRMGIRLRGPSLASGGMGFGASFPVCQGAIQIPPDGRPIVLSADCQTLGGYPVVACVIAADLPVLGRLRPAAGVQFTEVTMEQAGCYRLAAQRELSTTLAGVALANRDL